MVRFKIRRGFGRKKSSLAEKLSKLLRRRGKRRVEEIIKGIIKREPITILPLKPTYTIIETYYVYEPFAKVNIVSIPEKGGMLGYYVEEFTLTRDEQEILEKLVDILTEELEPAESIEDLKSYVAREVIRLANKYRSVFKLTGSRRAKILYYVERNLLGYGPIDPLMRDPNIEDISCDGAGKPIYVWHKKYESLPTNIIFNTNDHLNDFIMRLAHMAGKHVSIAFPVLDAMLPEKHRLAATFGTEVSPRGPTFTIRKFREKPLSPTELIKSGVVNELFAAYIWYMVEKRRTFMIAGGTGAGKTTLLNAFSLFIRPGMKIVTVEDTPELNLPHENWVQLSTRVSYALMGQTSGEITLYDLIKVSLRYRPDYIIVGEVRGEEAFVLFQAMASVGYSTPVLIKDSDGNILFMKIGEFIDKFYEEGEERIAKEVNGYYILSHDRYDAVWKPIKYVLRHMTDEIYEIKLEGGGRIEATGSHSVFVLDPETLDVVVKPVEKLRNEDLLLSFNDVSGDNKYQVIDVIELLKDRKNVFVDNIPEYMKEYTGGRNPIPVQQYVNLKNKISGSKKPHVSVRLSRSKYSLQALIKLDEDLAYVFGAYIADGCVKEHRGKRICFTFGVNEEHIANRVRRIMYKKFKIKPSISNRGTFTIHEYHHTLLAAMFEKLMGAKLAEKRIPNILWNSPRKVIRAFFEGLKADSRRTLKRRYTSYTTVNKELAYQLLWLARVAGYYSELTVEKGSGKNAGKVFYNVLVYLNREYVKPNASERIPTKPLIKLIELAKPKSMPLELTYILRRRFVSKRVAFRVLKWIKEKGVLNDYSRDYLRKLEAFLKGKLVALRIREIVKKEYKGYVYDISVPGTESFFGGNIPVLLHNTGHGGLSTIHAETLDYAIKRLTSPPMNIPPTYMKLMNIFMHIKRVVKPKTPTRLKVERKVTIAQEVADYNDFRTVMKWDPIRDVHEVRFDNSVLLRELAEQSSITVDDVLEDIYKRAVFLKWLIARNIFDVWEVARYIFKYSFDPSNMYRMALEDLKSLGVDVEALIKI